jgi:hypothetical protein
MTDLIKANRELFRNLVVNAELSSVNFLTVVHSAPSRVDSFSGINPIPGRIMQLQLNHMFLSPPIVI